MGKSERILAEEQAAGITRICTKCNQDKPLDLFPSSPRGRDGFAADCKACRVERGSQLRREGRGIPAEVRKEVRRLLMASLSTKICTACGIEKDIEEFHFSGGKRISRCKDCKNAIKREWCAANPEKARGYVKKTNEKYPEKTAARLENWRQQNQEKIRDYNERNREAKNAKSAERVRALRAAMTPDEKAEYREKYRELHRKASRAYMRRKLAAMTPKERAEYREKYRVTHTEAQARRRVRLKSLSVVEKIDRAAIIARDNSTCYICLKVLSGKGKISLDHVIPISKGGSHTADNLRVCCRRCNSRKNAKSLEDFLKELSEE